MLHRHGAGIYPELPGYTPSFRDNTHLAFGSSHSLPHGNSEVECACCLPHTQQAELATFQEVSGLESRLFSSPSSTGPWRALIKVSREMKEPHGRTVVRKGCERHG